MDVVIYTRVSTEDQKENGFSLQDQLRRLKQHCKQSGKNIIRHYEDNHSAKDFNRPAFQRFLAELKSKAVKPKQLVIVRADRFSRSVDESLMMTKVLTSYGVELHFLENHIDLSTPESLLPYLISIAIPQIENERRGLNTKQGQRQGLRAGRWMWHAPRGYENDRVSKLVVIGKEAHFIVRAFTEVAYGLKSIDAIRKKLNADGFECSKQGFLNILRSPFYKGVIVVKAWKKEPEEVVKGLHNPLIEEELFEKVQQVLAGKGKKLPNATKLKEIFPLRGHLLCKSCGNRLTASASQGRKKKYPYYHCQNGCNERISADIANQCFQEHLNSLKVNKEVVDLYGEILQDVFEQNEETKESRIRDCERNAATLKVKLSDLDDKLLDGTINGEDYQRMSSRIKDEIKRHEREVKDLSVAETAIDMHFKYGVSLISKLSQFYNEAPIELKHLLVGSIFPENLVYEDGNYRTVRENAFVSLITSKSNNFKPNRKKKATVFGGLSTGAPPLGLEPRTL